MLSSSRGVQEPLLRHLQAGGSLLGLGLGRRAGDGRRGREARPGQALPQPAAAAQHVEGQHRYTWHVPARATPDPRHTAAMMARLLEMGADPRCQDGEGRTCLHLAANNDSRAAAEILIKMKVSPRRSRH